MLSSLKTELAGRKVYAESWLRALRSAFLGGPLLNRSLDIYELV